MAVLRAVLVGCGGMGNNWARVLGPRPDIGIVGLVDVVPSASAALAGRNGLDVPRFGSLDEALRSIDVDVVLDTSIPETRRQIAGEAMEAGCHVLSEKPLATSVEEALELLAISARTGKTHAVMQNRRYLAGTQGMRQLVADGVIGEVGMVCADFFLGAHFGGFREEMANILLLDMAIHTFDQARFMTGSDAVTAWCDEFNLPGSWYQGNASALAVFEMADGSRYCYRGSWSAQGAATSWEAEWRISGSTRYRDLGRSIGTLRGGRGRCRRLRAPNQARGNHRRLERTERPRRLPGRNGYRVGQGRTAHDPLGGQRQEPWHGARRNRERR